MASRFFREIVFGPVISRRLGISLGINLLPHGQKICSFNCLYCECGLTPHYEITREFPPRDEVETAIFTKLSEIKSAGQKIDHITFAGNGEPTLHPDFLWIMQKTIEARNTLVPGAKISVLSNSTTLQNNDIFKALLLADNRIMKLDSAVQSTFELINQSKLSVQNIIGYLAKFHGNVTVQTMFLKGMYENNYIDNTTTEEIDIWLSALQEIKPVNTMIYTIDREPPVEGLIKLSAAELDLIADRVRKAGFSVNVAL